MSLLYISVFEIDGAKKWGLFYKDEKGKINELSEDFKQVVFDSESEAYLHLFSENLIIKNESHFATRFNPNNNVRLLIFFSSIPLHMPYIF